MNSDFIRTEAKYLVAVAALFAVYVATARLGLSLYAVNGFATLIWPPTGIAIAAILLYGYRLWPGVALGAFAINLLIGATPPVALGIALGNTLEAVLAAYLLGTIGFQNSFSNLRHALGFVVIAGFIGTAISASIGATSLWLGGVLPLPEVARTWFIWWIGDALGALTVAPLLIIWISATRARVPLARRLEIFSLAVFLIALNILAFWSSHGEIVNLPLIYLTPVPLIWSTLRFGARGKTLAIFLTGTIATASTVLGHGPFAAIGIADGLLLSQAYVGGMAIVFLLFASVVEERRKALEELSGYVGQLEQALERISFEDQAKTDFLAILAHELRNPLAPVISAIELMKAQGVGEENVRPFEIVDSQVHSIASLLDDLLDISRISRQKMRLKKETVDIRLAIAHAKDTVEPLMKEKEHALELILPEEPVYLSADSLRLEQIVVNLLTNAAKYTEAGGHIALSVRREGAEVVLSVRDSGIGIEPRLLPKVFEPFLQGEAGARMQEHPGGAGLGIGLSLTKRLVELHGGTISAESPGQGLGSEFTVRLPALKRARMPISSPAEAVASAGRSKRRKVLVVDDNKPAAEGIALLLERNGHEARIAHDGTETLALLEEYAPEVVILDIGLPDMSGYEVAEKIKSKMSGIAIIALTGYGQSEDRRRTKEAGFIHHLIKPVGITDVEQALATLP